MLQWKQKAYPIPLLIDPISIWYDENTVLDKNKFIT